MKHVIIYLTAAMMLGTGCKKFVEVSPPADSVNGENVYLDDATAVSALTGIYASLTNEISYATLKPITRFCIYTGVCADELTLHVDDATYLNLYKNKLSANGTSDTEIWKTDYQFIFKCNAAIEGLTASTSLTPAIKQQLLGEAKFVRAYFYFGLFNLYGDAPLVLSTNYKETTFLSRAPAADLYQQMVKDLQEAKELLSTSYADGKGVLTAGYSERVRPNKGTATALLARVYLYGKKYAEAEAESTELINNKGQYDTVSLAGAFLKNTKETIWAIQQTASGKNTGYGQIFILPEGGPTSSSYPMSLSGYVVNAFEEGDLRKSVWTGNITVSGKTFYYANKYKVGRTSTSVTEYPIVFRLSEQYLIRAEARTHLSKFGDALDDLNVIRKKAGLPLNSTATTSDLLLKAIANERVVELFTEGHRWLDLKRTGTIDEVMSIVTPQKGGIWKPEWALWPIPNSDRLLNDHLSQNPGYEY